MTDLSLIALGIVAVLVPVLVLMVLLPRLLLVASPNEVILLSGMRPRGRKPYRIVRGGRAIRVPLLERADRLDLTTLTVSLDLQEVMTHSLLPIALRVSAALKIEGSQPLVDRAATRLLGKSRSELLEIAVAILEGTVRATVAKLSFDEINQDGEKYKQLLIEEGEQDLRQLGLQLDTVGGLRVSLDAFTDAADGSALSVSDVTHPDRSSAAQPDDPLAFLPEPSLYLSLSARATSSQLRAGAELRIELDDERLSLQERGGDGDEVLTTILLEQPFTVMLGHSTEADGSTLIHVDVRQERAGSSVRVGLSSTTRSFSAPVVGLPPMQPRFPRCQEPDMLELLAGLRGVMHKGDGERWQGQRKSSMPR